MEYQIISVTRPHFLHSCGYYSPAVALKVIASGDVYRHLMPEYKQDKFVVVPAGTSYTGKNLEEVESVEVK